MDVKFKLTSYPGWMEKSVQNGFYDVPIQSGDYQVQVVDRKFEVVSDTEAQKGTSSLELLAFAYGNSSDSEEDQAELEMSLCADENDLRNCSLQCNIKQSKFAHGILSSKSSFQCDSSVLPLLEPNHHDRAAENLSHPLSRLGLENEISAQMCASDRMPGCLSANFKNRNQQTFDSSLESGTENLVSMESKSIEGAYGDPIMISEKFVTRSGDVQHNIKLRSECLHVIPSCSPAAHFDETAKFSNAEISEKNKSIFHMQQSDDDSSRMHIFCLEHAVEVEKQLHLVGGVHMLLLCHPGEF